ncbi:nucleotidyltransferase domain-containing protein [Jeotgalibacillus salarius]|uniref:Nucleotidyltransferase domain-containing protein n=1 Tax=Jeotgalibacillus salarius TaxID=546023 RepID=A0A4Y8LHG8_9BACL|nr:aminoglycoside 6-adenylyltransferase [Jeotgalibacillus salarius]TFE02242.1 nucleotidyltransferase domain-containing protein [Jeotgalibacillus salarius]
MNIQMEAAEKITESLKNDPLVKAVVLKGSLGRNEGDEFSDVDLYCFVDGEKIDKFLPRRVEHLSAYGSMLFHESLFIIAPQVITVYDNLLHVDLFTVTEETFKTTDYFTVLYDPENLMEQFKDKQHLTLSAAELEEQAFDIGWFLFQYRKAWNRGNDIWAIEALHLMTKYLVRVLFHRYAPHRAQLGMKDAMRSLPAEPLNALINMLEHITPQNHEQAMRKTVVILKTETVWLKETLGEESEAFPFIEKMIEVLDGERVNS